MTIPRPSANTWRDAVLFLAGIVLIFHEIVIRSGPERPTVLLLLAAMVGLPAFLRADERQPSSSSEPTAGEQPR